jgi:phosphoadenosine phosphosulfate reductase
MIEQKMVPEPSLELLTERIETTPTLEDRIRLITSYSAGRVAFSTSLGMEDQALLHAVAAAGRKIDVFMLDTGRHFQETLDTLEASELRYGLGIRVIAPAAHDIEELVSRDGINGFRFSIEARKACCEIRKVMPLRRALHGAAFWMTGLRRGQSAGRGAVPFATRDETLGLIKVNPLADWSLERLQDYVRDNNIPVNALHARGYPSIGCQPCTRPVRDGEDIRAGRWWWENEDGKECGLHKRSPTLARVP